MTTLRTTTALAALAAGLAAPATAQDAFAIPEIVVSANLFPAEAARVGSTVTVVTEEDLEKTAELEVGQYLSKLAGVTVTQSGPLGSASNLRIRGAGGEYVAVFVDGIRVDDPSLTEVRFDFGGLTTADVSRIEVLRGSQSALYGGSAVGGVINITTKRAEVDGTVQDAAIEYGSYNSRRASYSFAQRTGPLATSLALSAYASDGFSAANEANGNTEDDAASGQRLSFGASYDATDSLTLGINGFYQRSEVETDGFNAFFVLVDQANTQSKIERGLRLFAEYDAGRTRHSFDLTGFSIARDIVSDDPNTFEGKRLTLGWRAQTEISPTLSLSYGLQHEEERSESTAIPGGSEQSGTSSAFAEAAFAVTDDLDVTLSGRFDETEAFGSFSTGRLAASWRPAEGTTIRAALGTGFRSPSIDERFGEYPSSDFVGNPDLQPETSTSAEIGIEQRFANGLEFGATLFRVETQDMIAYVACPTFPCAPGDFNTLENDSGTSVQRGVELSAGMPLGASHRLDGSYARIDSLRGDGRQVGLVPKRELRLGLESQWSDELSSVLEIAHVSGRLDTFSFAPMEDYTVANATLTYEFDNATQAYLRIENLADTDYELVDGYGTSGRAFYVGLRKSF